MKIKHLFWYISLSFLVLTLVVLTAQVAIAQKMAFPTSNSIKDDFDLTEFSNLLFSLWFIAWLVESFFEIIQKIFKIDQNQNIKKDSIPSPVIARWTAIGGFVIGIIIFLSGVHTIGMLFDVSQGTNSFQAGLFVFIDAVLTASVIAGGSQGIHELTNAYKGIMQTIQDSTSDKNEISSPPQPAADTKLN